MFSFKLLHPFKYFSSTNHVQDVNNETTQLSTFYNLPSGTCFTLKIQAFNDFGSSSEVEMEVCTSTNQVFCTIFSDSLLIKYEPAVYYFFALYVIMHEAYNVKRLMAAADNSRKKIGQTDCQ